MACIMQVRSRHCKAFHTNPRYCWDKKCPHSKTNALPSEIERLTRAFRIGWDVELSAFYFCYYYKLLPWVLLKNEGQREASVENECIFRGKTYLNPILAQTNFLSRSRDCPKQTKKDSASVYYILLCKFWLQDALKFLPCKTCDAVFDRHCLTPQLIVSLDKDNVLCARTISWNAIHTEQRNASEMFRWY